MKEISPESVMKKMGNVLRMLGYKYSKHTRSEKNGMVDVIIAPLPLVHGKDNCGVGYEVNSDLIFGTIDPGDKYQSFSVWYGMPFKRNVTMHQYSPHAILSPTRSPWGQEYFGYFCGSNNLVKYRTMTDLVRMTSIQLARCEYSYHVPAQRTYTCVFCGNEFLNQLTSRGDDYDDPACIKCSAENNYAICNDRMLRKRGSWLAYSNKKAGNFYSFADVVCTRLEVRRSSV